MTLILNQLCHACAEAALAAVPASWYLIRCLAHATQGGGMYIADLASVTLKSSSFVSCVAREVMDLPNASSALPRPMPRPLCLRCHSCTMVSHCLPCMPCSMEEGSKLG